MRYLARQGLALRGHEESEGNMLQLLHMWSMHNIDVKGWQKGKYLSHQIVNELMADHILREILSEIKSTKFFVIQADEATDVACNNKMRVAILWVSEHYEIFEELVQLPKTDAATVFRALKDVLVHCVLPVQLCRGQAYHEAANMFGHLGHSLQSGGAYSSSCALFGTHYKPLLPGCFLHVHLHIMGQPTCPATSVEWPLASKQRSLQLFMCIDWHTF